MKEGRYMKKDFSKIDNEEEFVEAVARDCIEHLSEKDKQCFRDNRDPYDYHTGYGMYIRNHYIHGKKLGFICLMADDLSHEIIVRIIEILNPGWERND